MAGTNKRLAGPVAMSATMTTNIYNQSSSAVYDAVRHIHVVNKTSAAATFSIWLGATGANAAGTELFSAQSVPANSCYDWYSNMRMDSTDFLVGGASAGATLTISVFGERFAS
jgi:hypothetical protein